MLYSPGFALLWTLRVVAAFIFLYMLLPRAAFSTRMWADPFESFYGLFCLALLGNILLIYLLASIRLYELMSVVGIYAVVWYLRYRRHRSEHLSGLVTISDLFELLDANPTSRRNLGLYFWQKYHRARSFLAGLVADGPGAVLTLTFAVIMLFSAYLRLADAFANAAPALSDSYVTLAWMKYITNRIVFYDGLYPQGFHIYLSLLGKVAAIDPLLVLKYAGPLNSLLTILGLYATGRILSGQVTGGLAAAFTYGVMVEWLPYEYVRQAATNSQEFALVFMFPALIYSWRYLESGRRQALLVAGAAFAITNLVHSMIALFTFLGMLAVAAAAWLALRTPRRRLGGLAATMVLAVFVGALPLAVGWALGVEVHASSLGFATGSYQLAAPPVPRPVQVAMVLPLVAVVMTGRRDRRGRGTGLASLFLVWGALLVHQAPRLGVHNIALRVRSGEFLAVAMALAAGMAWGALARVERGRRRWAGAVASLLVAAVLTTALAPEPARPYKMQYNGAVEQYLRIAANHLPTSWLIVSDEEGYALAYGRGWHLMLADFLDYVSPTEEKLVYRAPGEETELLHPHIFIFHEREPYRVEHHLVLAELPRRQEEERRLLAWIEAYSRVHDNIEVYYEDEEVVVWVINQPLSPEERFRRLWSW